jgi:hypothetical protein
MRTLIMPEVRPNAGFKEAQIEDAVKRLVDEAKAAVEKRGDKDRTPFFCPINIMIEEDGRRWNFSGFSREIAPTSIGMLHDMSLEPGETVVVTIPKRSASHIRLQGKLTWCEPCGEGWYISGAEFCGVLPAK